MIPSSSARCLATWLAATAAAALLGLWVLPDLRGLADGLAAVRAGRGGAPFALWLTWGCAVAVALSAVWGWWVTTVVVAEALTGRERPARAGVPAWARRAVLGACGALVVGAVVPGVASAATPSGAAAPSALDAPDPGARPGKRPGSAPSGERALDGLPLPDRAVGPSASEAVARALVRQRGRVPRAAVRPAVPAAPPTPPRIAPTPRPATTGAPVHVVRPGESLWSVAEDAFARAAGTPASAAEVAAYWPEVYAANRDLIGADPDLIRPGQAVRTPPPPVRGEDAR